MTQPPPQRPPRRVDLIAQAFAERLLREVEQHIEARAGFWLECVIAEMAPGETIDLSAPKIHPGERTARDAAVVQAVEQASDASVRELARRLGVSKSTVHRVKQRRRGTIGIKG